ncbi:DUF7661 family protein [Microbulbifer hydrolyticus]|uniref:DUF7661 domain-containing protein n=1 Tax=Microbulbifer hydrolyticus TaxID=48074 RepID=A0A6P1TFT2_9GAMM|nr:hypothetical protein [Microbulbifer hydrolyticus]MBB5213050.1 hypothetical protein [Microbulbifer hydrolyticus]QHQ40410.1 hypothetical protein GTQ55_16470 [Microbulbifer hydrolyticus]
MTTFRYNVFGREILVEKSSRGWSTFQQGAEGKRRSAGLHIPDNITETELTQYLDDLCHEWASEKYPSVFLVRKN